MSAAHRPWRTDPHPPAWIGATQPRGGVLGHLAELHHDPLGLFTRCAREYGDLVRLRLGPTRMVLVSHPALVEDVLVTRHHHFHKNLNRRLGSALGNGLLVSEGSYWLRQRRMMQPAFHRQRIDSLAETMVSVTKRALDGWHANPVRDLYLDMTDVSLQIVARTLFGIDVSPDLQRIRQSSQVMTDHLRSRLFSLAMLLPDNVPTPGNLRYAAAIRDLDRLVYRLIAERRAIGHDRQNDLLSTLLQDRDADGQGLTDRQVRDEVFTMMSAGYDTTALAVTWAWVLLSQYPEAEARMRAEIDAVLGNAPPSAADLPRLPYVGSVVAETLRLYPSAWAIAREAVCDTQIAGEPVAKKSTVLVSPWVLHRDPRFFEQPAAFRPERWADALAQRLPRFAYMPFGGGPRICLGSTFAQLEIVLLVTLLAQRFRLELTDPTHPVEPIPVLTLQPSRPVQVAVSAR
ncbi:MAG: cytochrome P450 [Chloroflexi bacterium]|nr:cytochrome P450 [Chloroflexota bacterium]